MNFKSIALTATIATLAFGHSSAFADRASAANLDQDTAIVSLEVEKFASLTGLDDFVLTTTDANGSAGAVYTGSDQFQLESNTQVRVSLTGGDLSNGADTIGTVYDIDDSGLAVDTAADSVHNDQHTVSAEATLGAIAGQKAGDYQAQITLTVSSL